MRVFSSSNSKFLRMSRSESCEISFKYDKTDSIVSGFGVDNFELLVSYWRIVSSTL